MGDAGLVPGLGSPRQEMANHSNYKMIEERTQVVSEEKIEVRSENAA